MNPLLHVQLIVELHGMIFCMIIGCILLRNKYKGFQGGNILGAATIVHALALFSDMMTWLTQGDVTLWGTFAVRWFNFTLYVMHISIVAMVALYFYTIMKEYNPDYGRKLLYSTYGCCIAAGLGLLVTPFTGFCYSIDAANRYARGVGFYIVMGLAGVGAILTVVMVIQNREHLKKKEMIVLLSFYVFPLLSIVCQTFVFGFSFIDIGIMISVFIMFYTYQKKLAAWSRQKDLSILQSQAYLLNSQIKPHFLFNSLNIIQSLIEEDPETAVQAVGHFSKYLRTGLKIEVMDAVVPLWKELDYVDNYLYLEQLRHGERLKIVRNIEQGIDFEIPFLTIQPIVENAVRHGVCKRLQGGTVTIDIRADYTNYVIQVIDDGVGFYPLKRDVDLNLKPDSGGAGVGMRNVEERLRMMCGGTMETDSEPGKGTVVTIKIPKAGKSTYGFSGSRR